MWTLVRTIRSLNEESAEAVEIDTANEMLRSSVPLQILSWILDAHKTLGNEANMRSGPSEKHHIAYSTQTRKGLKASLVESRNAQRNAEYVRFIQSTERKKEH
jgi:hypothetical protein